MSPATPANEQEVQRLEGALTLLRRLDPQSSLLEPGNELLRKRKAEVSHGRWAMGDGWGRTMEGGRGERLASLPLPTGGLVDTHTTLTPSAPSRSSCTAR